MSWCPQCDETFPEGPSCPRCRTPLIDNGPGRGGEELQGQIALPQLKVPRRIRRAFGRPMHPPAPSRQLMAFVVSLVLIAGGFALGRMSALPADSPVIRSGPAPALDLGLPGFVDMVGRVPGPAAGSADLALVRIALNDGASASTLGRFMSPFGGSAAGRESTRIVALQESVAVVLTDHRGRGVVGAFPASRPPVLWLDASDAAWESADVLLVRNRDAVSRWVFTVDDVRSEPLPGSWIGILPTPDGAVLEAAEEGRHVLYASSTGGPRRVMEIPSDARTVAVAPRSSAALIDLGDGLKLWDGTQARPASPLQSAYEVHGAAFSPDGQKVAVTLRERGEDGTGQLQLAVMDRSGATVTLTAGLASWSAQTSCPAVPTWDGSQSWVFLAPNDGTIFAAEVGGGRQTRTRNFQSVGCGIAWSS